MAPDAIEGARTRQRVPERLDPLAALCTVGGVIQSQASATLPGRVAALIEATRELAERFVARGHELYLVGGSVRDAVFGNPAERANRASREAARGQEGGSHDEEGRAVDGAEQRGDLDLATSAPPDETERIVRDWADAVWLQGKRFGTVACSKAGRRYEITTFRAERYQPHSRKPEVRFGRSIEEDLARRDFTVNAMALRLPDPLLVDPFGGLEDLARRRLRTPLDPAQAFEDDPLRMLRATRFVATLGFEPVPELVAAMRAMAPRLEVVSAERIRDELSRLLVAPRPSPGLWLVVRTGLAEWFLPELPALALEQDPIHRHKDVLAHTIAVVDRTGPDLVVRLAALLHDIGKPATRAYGPEGVTFHHHDVVGARMARTRLEALRYPGDVVDAVTRLVELHLRFHTYRFGWTDRAVRRYVRDAGSLLERLNELIRADCTTRNPAKARALARRMDELERRIRELAEQEALDAIRPDLDGHQVMALLGVPPGLIVGEALAFLLELRMEEGPLGEDEARRRLLAWWETRQAGQEAAPGSSMKRSTS
jgi:poly(A) polymerase